MNKKLKGKRAVITGASRGIGKGIAKLFALNGADIGLIARNSENLKKASDEISEINSSVVFAKNCDITSLDQIQSAFNSIRDKFGNIDILVNSAAILKKASMMEISPSLLRSIIETNFFGAFNCSRMAFDLMKEYGGTIINISSLSGVFGVPKFPDMGAYNISKYALWGLTEILALEWAKFGIRVNAVSPGGVDTDMFKTAFPGAKAPLTAMDVAKVCLFLASDDSSAITGENIIVRGL